MAISVALWIGHAHKYRVKYLVCSTVWTYRLCMDYGDFGRPNFTRVMCYAISLVVQNWEVMRESLSMQLTIHTDGGARGNPGPAAVGVVIEGKTSKGSNSNNVQIEFGKKIGETTNNVAEYTAVIEALRAVKDLGKEVEVGIVSENEVIFLLDSTLVVNQINGVFKVKESHLRQLLFEVHALETEVGGKISYTYVPRAMNSRADFFVNKALDTP